MKDLLLPALDGMNPLGFLAALGVLDATTRREHRTSLYWTDDLVPQAVLRGIEDADELLRMLDEDRLSWVESLVLRYPDKKPLSDAKPDSHVLREWFESAYSAKRDADSEMLCAIVAEGAYDRSKKAKPTHLHFTAGQQQFLDMVRTLSVEVNRNMLAEAIIGPWEYRSALPSLSWDARGERLYAVRATNPSGEKRLGVPGADWLAFRGLRFYPVSSADGTLRTTACNRAWKSSAFRWPLWSAPASREVVWSLVGDRGLVSDWSLRGQQRGARPQDLAARGILRIVESPIKRSDQGGYGSFGGPTTLASATPAVTRDGD